MPRNLMILGILGLLVESIILFTLTGCGQTRVSEPAVSLPAISSVLPVRGASGVETNTTIIAIFSVNMDPSTISTSTFTLASPEGAVTGTATYDATNYRAIFTPSADLIRATTYTATIAAEVKDTAGNPMGTPYAWSFTTYGKVATPTIAPAAGTYETPQSINLECSTSGASIYYTLDGSTPTSSSTLYALPFELTTSKTIKAIALKLDMASSVVATASYEIYHWETLGGGMNAAVDALAFDSSGNLYAGGSFTTAGGNPASYIAKWNGSAWSAFGGGKWLDNYVKALALDSSGNLYAGGNFTTAGGVTVNGIAKWNTSSATWEPFGRGTNNLVNALIRDSSGNLYAGGSFTVAYTSLETIPVNYIAKWNTSSSTWEVLGGGMNGAVNALALDSSGNLYVGGAFTVAYTTPALETISARYIARWNSSSSAWESLGGGLINPVNALTLDSSGNLYAGGEFTTTAGGAPLNYIGKWNGTSWSILGTGTNLPVHALLASSSGNLYAGGEFGTAGGTVVLRAAKWNGSSWSALGSGFDNTVNALALDSSGTLYAGFNPSVLSCIARFIK